MRICPFMNGKECAQENCQLFITWHGSRECAIWWLAVNTLIEFEDLEDDEAEAKYKRLIIRETNGQEVE